MKKLTMEWNIKTIFCILLPTLFALSAGADYKIKPKNYKLIIRTNEKNFIDDAAEDDLRFSGEVDIDFEILKASEDSGNKVDIILDTNPNMTFNNVILKGQKEDDDWEAIAVESKDHNNDKINIKFVESATKFKLYRLNMVYSNLLRNDMTGLYRSSYVDSAGETRWLLTTHFEPIYARKVFPCFDSPDKKAEFEIIINAPKGKNVLCNTPVTQKESVFTCKKSLPMSTYLVAFTISDFIGTDPVSFQSDYPELSERKLTTYGRPDIIKNGDGKFAQIVGKAAVDELSKYLGIGYAFDKIDQVGIPDFSAGAMENWGHISFREKSLFFNEQTGSTPTKQANALTITHELVHQWFGNLVTLESWDYIWLNEAFANYLEFVIASKFQEPRTSEWELMKQFVVIEIHSRAFETDGLNSSKPLNNKITDESLILPSFNDIPYAKGATVLRMWENALGSEKFQNSLRKYLKARALNSANPKQLFEHFKSEAKMEEGFFSTWTEQAGYPLVEVKKNKNGTYTLTQKRFFWDNTSSDATWFIPITYSSDVLTNLSTSPETWLYKEPVNVNITGKWIILNNLQTGYYRVNYDQENWDALSKALETDFTSINELNRAQIINDVYSLARSLQGNYVKYQTALTLTKYLEKDKSYYPWKTALNAFDFLRTKLREGKVCDMFNDYVLSLIKPHFKKLDSSEANHIEKLKNIEISRWACSLGHEACLKEAKELFKNSKYNKLPDVQEIVLCTAVRHTDAWDTVFNKYLQEKDSALKVMYLTSLGCTNNATKAEEFLNKTLAKDSGIRKQDLGFVLSSVYNGNLKHVGIAFKFIEVNFKAIAKTYGGINPLGKAVAGIAKKLNSKEEYVRLIKLVEQIMKGEEGRAAKDSLDNALNIVKNNVEWVEQRMNQFHSYFNAGSFLTYSLTLLSLCLVTLFQF